MKNQKLIANVARLLAVIMLLSMFAALPMKASAADSAFEDLVAEANEVKAGNEEFPMQISAAEDGSDVNKAWPWVTASEMDALDEAIASGDADVLEAAIALFKSQIKADGSDPYFRLDPGKGQEPVPIATTTTWTAKSRYIFDNRVPSNNGGSTIELVDYPFADNAGKGQLLQINYVNPATTTFGGVAMTGALAQQVNIPSGSNIEFDVYYPKSAEGKYMRWRFSGSGYDSYLRDYDYHSLNPEWTGSYMGETWLKTHVSLPSYTGNKSAIDVELHGENSRPKETGTLLISQISITAPDTTQAPLPMASYKESWSEVAPLKDKYNVDNGMFMTGTLGLGTVSGIRERHFTIFLDGNNMKSDSTHPNGPSWLTDVNGTKLGSNNYGISEYRFPDSQYQAVLNSGEPGEYAIHAHVLAWYNQAPSWMTKIRPEHLTQGYQGNESFYALGNGVSSTTPVDKNMARRVQYNHIVNIMRHMFTTEAQYGSSESRGLIPFHTWDVLNEEVHESQHSAQIPGDPSVWKTCLKHTNWLIAMSDDDIASDDLSNHYIYLLFKFAHIAVPNAQMAEAYKANYDSLPDYMKMDNLDKDGSIDDYVVENPPLLTYNDYGTGSRTKGKVVYNMAKALNTAWQSDPLYDGRPLIEIIGFQGHDTVTPTLASDYNYVLGLCNSLVDDGLLTGVSFSEFDLKLGTDAPGGGAKAPAALNIRQADALGYEFALMYKLFIKYAPMVDHILNWGTQGSGWEGGYLLFDGSGKAMNNYYAAMDPDRYIQGHEYLEYYFEGEYEALCNEVVDLGEIGTYIVGKGMVPEEFTAEIAGIEASLTTSQLSITVDFTEAVDASEAEIALAGIEDAEYLWNADGDQLVIFVPYETAADLASVSLSIAGLKGFNGVAQEEAFEAEIAVPALEARDMASLAFDGNISANFYLDLKAYDGIEKVEVTYSDPTKEVPTPKTDVYTDFAALETGFGLYEFVAEAAPAQVCDNITIIAYGANGQVIYTNTITIEELLERYIDFYADDAEVVALCQNYLTYAKYAQDYFFGESAVDEANVLPIDNVTADLVADYATVGEDLDLTDGVNYKAMTFSCRSNSVMRYAFTAKAGVEYTAEFVSGGEGMEISVTKSGSQVIVNVSGIAAAQLDDEYVIGLFVDGVEIYEVSSSALSYVKAVLGNASASEELVNLAKAIYNYSVAANVYFG